MSGNTSASSIAGTVIVIVNLILTIGALRSMSGFWYCTGAFFLFMLTGSITGGIGMAIGCAAAGNDGSAALKFSIIGVLIGSIAGCCGIAKLVYGLNYIALLTN